MSNTMQAAFYIKPGVMEVQETSKPVPGPGQVLIAVKAVGICGSDLTLFNHGMCGSEVADKRILGHEGAGVIAGLGPGVTGLKDGDAVIMEPGISCGKCEYCKQGRYNLCPEVKFASNTPLAPGYMAEFVTLPAELALPMPTGQDFEKGTLMEPLSVGFMAAREADVQLGHSVAIFGAGTVGLAALLAAQVHGATRTFVVDLMPNRLNVARQLGATEVIDARTTDPLARILEATGGRGVDRVLEAAGSPKTSAMAIKAVKRGGTVAMIGVIHDPEAPLDLIRIVDGGIRVQGIFRYANIHPVVVEVVRSGKVNLDPFVTHRWALKDVQTAFDFVTNNKDVVIKGVVTI